MSVRMENVSCSAQGAVLVEGVSLEVRPGECVLLCGPSGSGKTTVTKCVNGLIPSFELGIERTGSVDVCGLAPGTCEMHELARKVGSVFQNPKSQFYHLTSNDELAFGLENAGVGIDVIERRCAEVVAEMGIERLLDRDVSKMSGGEKQALVFASVAVADPDVYVLDEPTANFDAAAIDILHAQIASVLARGKSVVIAEHRLAFMNDLIDRAILMEGGRAVRVFSPEELVALSQGERAQLGLRATSPADLPAYTVSRGTKADAAPLKAGLSLRDFGVFRGKRPVFDPVSIDIAPGTVAGVVGANGTGKSTLLRAIAGLGERTRGNLYLDGRDMSRRERRKACSMVMQDVNHQLFSDSVRGDCELSCKDDALIDETLASLDLACVAHRHPHALSGGQKQRLAMASALLSNRPVVLLDEPTSGLDYAHMVQAGELVRALAARGSCVIVATHDTEFLSRCCDRVYQLT